jgi:hypothetical protein
MGATHVELDLITIGKVAKQCLSRTDNSRPDPAATFDLIKTGDFVRMNGDKGIAEIGKRKA